MVNVLLIQQSSDDALPSQAFASTLDSLVVSTPSDPIALGQYLRETRKTDSGPLTVGRLSAQLGRVVTFRGVNLQANMGDRCELRWTMIDQTRNRPAAEGFWRYNDVMGWPDGLFYPDDSTKELSGEIWVPAPFPEVATDQFVVNLKLICARTVVANTATAPFTAFTFRTSDPATPVQGAPLPDQTLRPEHDELSLESFSRPPDRVVLSRLRRAGLNRE
jgi:hypothetical protein